jgi:hypothetical protein
MTDLKVVDGKKGEMPGTSDERELRFDRAYSEWVSALADIAKFNAGEYETPDDDIDALNGQLCDRQAEVERRLILMPASTGDSVSEG